MTFNTIVMAMFFRDRITVRMSGTGRTSGGQVNFFGTFP